MSWEDEHIDNLFREAASEQKVEFKNEFWEEFEKMLPEKKKKKIGLIYWWFGAGFVAVVAIFSFINLSNSNSEQSSERQISLVKNERIIPNSKTKKQSINNSHSVKTIVKPEDRIVSHSNFETKYDQLKSFELFNEESRTSEVTHEIHTSKVEELLIQQIENEEVSLNFKSYSFFTNATILSSNLIKSKSKKWHPYLDLYYSLNQSPIKNSELGSNFSNGFGFGSGMSYSSKVFNFTIGLNLAIQNYSNLMINDRAKVYGFGVTNYEQNINYNNFYLLEMPIYTGLKSKKHQIQIGIVSSYLLNTRLHYQLKEEELITQSGNYYNFRKGLNSIYFKPSIKYAFNISPTFQIGTVIQFQMNTILKDIQLFSGTENKHPINGQLFIRKTLH